MPRRTRLDQLTKRQRQRRGRKKESERALVAYRHAKRL